MPYERLDAAVSNPLRQLVETAWAYVQFALSDPAHFEVTLSGMVEKEKDYPAYGEMSM